MVQIGAEHPLVALRRRLGLSRAEFARATGTPYEQLSRAEQGYVARLPRSVRAAVEMCGDDPHAAEAAYQQWRKEQIRCLAANALAAS